MAEKTTAKYFYFFSTVVVLFFIWICRPQGLYFLADDFVHIPLSADNTFYDVTWLRPVSRISLWLNAHIFGMGYVSFYLTNLAFHFINAILIYFLAIKIKRFFFEDSNQHNFFPFLSAILFLVYSSHAESIFWIVGRGGSLVTVFIQLSLIFYFSEKKVNYFFSYLFFAIALFTYELAWALPLCISFFELCDKFIIQTKKINYKFLVYWAILFIYFFIRYFILKGELNDYEAGAYLHLDLQGLLYHFFTALSRVFVPAFENPLLFSFITVLTFFFFFILFIKFYKQNKKNILFVFICLVALCIYLIPILAKGANTHNSEAERFIYLASIFWCFIIAFLVSLLKNVPLKFVLSSIVITIQLFFFYSSSNDYKYGAYVTKYIVDEVNKLPNTDTLHLQNLPSAYRGAIIFRSGFPTSARGIFNKEFKKIDAVSYKELFKKTYFKTVQINIHSTPENAYFFFKNDTLFVYK